MIRLSGPFDGKYIAIPFIQYLQGRIFIKVGCLFVLPDHEIGIPVQLQIHQLSHIQVHPSRWFVEIKKVGITLEPKGPDIDLLSL